MDPRMIVTDIFSGLKPGSYTARHAQSGVEVLVKEYEQVPWALALSGDAVVRIHAYPTQTSSSGLILGSGDEQSVALSIINEAHAALNRADPYVIAGDSEILDVPTSTGDPMALLYSALLHERVFDHAVSSSDLPGVFSSILEEAITTYSRRMVDPSPLSTGFSMHN